MLFSRGLFFSCTAALMLFFSPCLNGQDFGFNDDRQERKSPDSLARQIQTYENVIAEMQRRPSGHGSLANIMTQLGDLYSNREDYPKAIYLYVRSIIIRQYEHTGKSDLAWQLVQVGNSFYRLHDYQLAEQAYRIAAGYFSATKDYQGMVTTVNNIGLCRLYAGDPKSAYPVFLKTLSVSKKIKDIPRIYASSIYIGISLTQTGRYSEAIEVLKKLSRFDQKSENNDLVGFRIFQLANAYMNSGDTANAISTLITLSGGENNQADDYYKAMAMDNLTWYYYRHNEIAKALRYAEDAYDLLKNKHHPSLLTDIHGLLYNLYKKSGNLNQSLFHLEAYHKGTIQLNNREIETFVSDYNKKMERIAISQELKNMREQSERARIEKLNQQSLSTFLIIIAVLLLVMLFTAKGFDSRIQLLLEHIKAYSFTQKLSLLFFLGLYFIVFYYFFVPVENSAGMRHLSFFSRLIPGAIAYFVTTLLILLFYSPITMRKPVKNWYMYSLYVFSLAFFSVLLAEFAHFYGEGFGGLNFLLSLSLIVLASFIVPLYLFILLVENLVLKHIESITQSLNLYINQLKQKPGPDNKLITIQSEKTSGKLSFDMSELQVVEAQGNYSMFYLYKNGTVSRKMLHITMKSIEENLADYKFIVRCHKSYLVNIHYVSEVTGNSRGYLLHFDNGTEPVPVSRNFQKEVMSVISKFKNDL